MSTNKQSSIFSFFKKKTNQTPVAVTAPTNENDNISVNSLSSNNDESSLDSSKESPSKSQSNQNKNASLFSRLSTSVTNYIRSKSSIGISKTNVQPLNPPSVVEPHDPEDPAISNNKFYNDIKPFRPPIDKIKKTAGGKLLTRAMLDNPKYWWLEFSMIWEKCTCLCCRLLSPTKSEAWVCFNSILTNLIKIYLYYNYKNIFIGSWHKS